jgi:hypothetical protein
MSNRRVEVLIETENEVAPGGAAAVGSTGRAVPSCPRTTYRDKAESG